MCPRGAPGKAEVNTEPRPAPRCLSGWQPGAEVLGDTQKAGKLLQEDKEPEKAVTALKEAGPAQEEEGAH